MTARYLVDKSAYARMRIGAVRDVLAPLIEAGNVATCGIITLEILFSARGGADLTTIRTELTHSLVPVPMEQRDFDRAIDVMAALAGRGQHRTVNLPDLLIAAAAERAGLAVLHYDGDFDRIAAVTHQAVEWVVPRGSI